MGIGDWFLFLRGLGMAWNMAPNLIAAVITKSIWTAICMQLPHGNSALPR